MTTADTRATAPEADALARARAVARAIGECAVFQAFEAAQDALDKDSELNERLAAFQLREQEARASRAWGGADPEEERALETEWLDLASRPALAAFLSARQELTALLQDVTLAIGEGVGVDFGGACAPAGGCC